MIARALRDAGFEIVYTGPFQTPAPVAEAALQEDADAVGLALPSGAPMTLIAGVVEELHARGIDPLVFTPESSPNTVGEWLEQALDRRETESAP